MPQLYSLQTLNYGSTDDHSMSPSLVTCIPRYAKKARHIPQRYPARCNRICLVAVGGCQLSESAKDGTAHVVTVIIPTWQHECGNCHDANMVASLWKFCIHGTYNCWFPQKHLFLPFLFPPWVPRRLEDWFQTAHAPSLCAPRFCL